MEPALHASDQPQQVMPLLADYDRWLAFLTACRLATRHYDQQLKRIKRTNPQLETLSNYLRDCMRHRTVFFGKLATLLATRTDQLRTDPTNADLVQRLTHAHPVLQLMIGQLTTAFAEIEDAYQSFPFLTTRDTPPVIQN
ncbi:hypothetical protein [Spirosoma agri]|uniref:Uncharacterized protein n=1 Tax=Spirosoma agri TaxID=1987381 RepID=A0A6M0IK59_9BACT|nr:hypothetical protein [Spirosoma agri]NEU68247.1 hypothetical protein [Spirosoma agri]